jgi:predicted NUDIX family NTP pyrophosphohydrolase
MSVSVLGVAATSAGILPFRRRGDSIELLLVHPGGPLWAKKDKGELDEGEEERVCALRELEEELGSSLGLSIEQLTEIGSVRQKSGKVVHGWAAKADFDPAGLRSNTFSMEWPPRSGRRQEFPEVDRAEWFEPEVARGKINPAQVEFIDRLLAL